MKRRPFLYIDTHDQLVEAAPLYLDPETFGTFGIDIETASDDPNVAFDPLRGWISTIQIMPEGNGNAPTLLIDVQEIARTHGPHTLDVLKPIIDIINDPRVLKVAHNAKFEIKWFIHHLKANPAAFFDTMLASQIIAAGDVTAEHSLEEVAYVFSGIELDKTEQKSDWGVRPLSNDQIEYALRDAEVVIPVHYEQINRLRADDLLRTAVIDFDAIKPLARIELNGMHLDAEMWRELLVKNTEKLEQITIELREMLQSGVDWTMKNPDKKFADKPRKPEKPVNPIRKKENRGRNWTVAERLEVENQYTADMKRYEFEMNRYLHEKDAWDLIPDEVPAIINPRSVPQMQKALKNITGIWFESTKDQFLSRYAGKYPVIAKLQEHRGMAKLVSSYGQNILDAMDENGRVHTDFRQILDTGRTSQRDPNLQQVPHDKVFRAPWTAPPGRKLIIADYSQIQLRILAQLALDPVFIEDFNSGTDMHTKGASRFYRVPVEDVDSDLRTRAKRTNFGVIFDIGDEKLGDQLGIAKNLAGQLKKAYFLTYKLNGQWLALANRQARQHLFARTMSGRLQRLMHDQSRGQISAIGRNGQNMPIQGTEADMMKRALYFVDERLYREYPTAFLINMVHDEQIAEADDHEAEAVAKVIEWGMEKAAREYITVVPAFAEAKVLPDWVKE
jgi:DNA polymerase I-like protein with 3'-5' exonuclease and polymerase domains